MITNTCIIIAGPTAVGKTALSIQLAKSLGTEIISADSRQCYRELNIGVAKPSDIKLAEVPHYFINSHSINDEVNARIFEEYALQKLGNIYEKKPVAIVVGGTGLYIDALCNGIDEIPLIPSEINEAILANYNTKGLTWLQKAIEQEDWLYVDKGEVKNPSRLIRALAVKRATGESILAFQTQTKKQRPFKIIKIGLNLPREILYKRINERVDGMMKVGLLEEAEELLHFRHKQALQTVGYRELFEYFDGRISLKEAVEKIKINSRHYAKRQLTWFKKDSEIEWFDAGDFDQLTEDVLSLYRLLKNDN